MNNEIEKQKIVYKVIQIKRQLSTEEKNKAKIAVGLGISVGITYLSVMNDPGFQQTNIIEHMNSLNSFDYLVDYFKNLEPIYIMGCAAIVKFMNKHAIVNKKIQALKGKLIDMGDAFDNIIDIQSIKTPEYKAKTITNEMTVVSTRSIFSKYGGLKEYSSSDYNKNDISENISNVPNENIYEGELNNGRSR